MSDDNVSKKVYVIPVIWKVSGYMHIEADSEKEAIEKAHDTELPSGTYVDGSFEINKNEHTDWFWG